MSALGGEGDGAIAADPDAAPAAEAGHDDNRPGEQLPGDQRLADEQPKDDGKGHVFVRASLRATLARLRIAGFKSFADPTTVEVLPGLTGVVGPNGCGKSNVVEALRWAMGETSAKSMRGGEMEDVIFAGTSTRRPRTSRSPDASPAARAPPSASTGGRSAPVTCRPCSWTSAPAPAPPAWSARAASPR